MRERWPRLMREIAEELGDDAALKLVARYGGQVITVPLHANGSKIAQEVGLEIAKALVALRGGDKLSVPNFGLKLAEERRRFILTHPDLSANDCAHKLGLTNRRVLQIRSEARGDPRQMDLFSA